MKITDWAVAVVLGFFLIGTAHAGSGAQISCEHWSDAAKTLLKIRNHGVSQDHALFVLDQTHNFQPQVRAILDRVAQEAYKWPRGDEDFGRFVAEWCKNGWQEMLQERSALPLRLGASSQKLYCERQAEFAVKVYRDITEYGFQTVNLSSQDDYAAVKDMQWCEANKRDIRSCVIERCMK